MRTFELQTDSFRRAILNIQRRAERQELEERLSKCFVPTRIIDDLQTDQNQLLFGRRGVGKTHTLKVYLAKKVTEGRLCSYLDCTSFGSGLGHEGTPQNIAIRFFSTFLRRLADNLLEHVVRLENPSGPVQDRLTAILSQMSELASPNSQGETFAYSEIIRLMNIFADEIQVTRMFMILDEWAQIPINAQPFFAEFLKRAFFANQRVTMKVGVVDYTYQLCTTIDGSLIGLEKSADIFSDIRMDEHFVWDVDQSRVESFFAELLFNHLALELNPALLDFRPSIKAETVRREVFTQDKSFSQLCRASEGNARDFIVIFGRSFDEFRKQQSHEKIGIDDVHKASISWYRSDKLTNLSSETWLEGFMQHLVDNIIAQKQSRTFMVPFRHIDHPLLRRLFAARILHPLNTEWSHPDKQGERFRLVTIDYGAYASFKGTKSQHLLDRVFWNSTAPEGTQRPEDLVPFDDRRSIRRIVVDIDVLNKFIASP